MTFAEVQVKRSVMLTDRLGPDILLVLRMKGQVLHRERAHLKVPGCSLVLSVLPTKKLCLFRGHSKITRFHCSLRVFTMALLDLAPVTQ